MFFKLTFDNFLLNSEKNCPKANAASKNSFGSMDQYDEKIQFQGNEIEILEEEAENVHGLSNIVKFYLDDYISTNEKEMVKFLYFLSLILYYNYIDIYLFN